MVKKTKQKRQKKGDVVIRFWYTLKKFGPSKKAFMCALNKKALVNLPNQESL